MTEDASPHRHVPDSYDPESEETDLFPAAAPEAPPEDEGPRIGARVGPYRILRRIARGGMGTVYLAQREDHFKQRVALKMIHPDKAGSAILERFYAERQILADLDHPHIARILDGGAGHGALPFFAMEYVEGEPVDVACAQWPLRRRLELFQKVCAAVHHAHRSLIVHRDLKPSNILATADGEPKLLDFGIAKILHPDTREDSKGPTDPRLMTISYASPEQLSGGAITIGTDIYSLGVLLYKILCGSHPHPRGEQSQDEWTRAICSDVPVPPSRVGTVDPKIARRLAGDLDAIVLKTLAKVPEDRYDSAAQLAEEIQLHLDDLPIRAWRGTWLGRLRKGARRNRLALMAGLSLLVFSSVVTTLWRHSVKQQAEAEQARGRAERTHEFMLDFFKSVEPDGSLGCVDIQQVLDSGRHSLDTALRDEPHLRADLLGTLGTIYYALALHEDARELQDEALIHRRAMRPMDSRKLAVDVNNLASTHFALKEYDQAEALLRESLPLWREHDDPFELNALAGLGGILAWRDENQQALEVYEAAIARSRSLGLEGDPKTATIYYGLGAAHRRLENYQAAEGYLRHSLRGYLRSLDAKPSRIAQVQSSLGQVLHALGRHSEARPLLEEALATRRQIFGDRNRTTAGSRKKLALLLIDLGEPATAESLLREAGATYSLLNDEDEVAEVRRIEERLAEIQGRTED